MLNIGKSYHKHQRNNMTYPTALYLLSKIDTFRLILKSIDFEKADKKRDGSYTTAIDQLNAILEGDLPLEVLQHPDNILRNIMLLASLDKKDCPSTI